MAGASVGPGTAGAAFVLLAIGFATKSGLVPLHVWLPLAHPQAPSHVSAAMSAAMVKLGVYGLVLTVTRLLPEGPRWWALVLLALGLPSALYGILQASVTSDLKRLLAFSTTENVGLMATALAVSMLTRTASDPTGAAGAGGGYAVAEVALVAVLMLAVSHAAFKTVLFLGAGSVLQATGERDLDRLGGLGTRMPVTAVAFAVGALGAAALPVSSGFVAEWVLLQTLIHGQDRQDRVVLALLPVTMAVVALTAGLALLTFVKAFGIAFLARPRSPGAAQAREAGTAMRLSLAAAAVLVLGLGLVPGIWAGAAARAVQTPGVVDGAALSVALPGLGAALNPAALTGLGVLVALPMLLYSRVLSRRHPRRAVELAWGCGGVRVSARMQYTATSFAEPLVRVFDDALAPARDLEVTHAGESRYLVERIRFSQNVADLVEHRLYRPVLRGLDRAADAGRRLHDGSVHRYLAFSFSALLLVLAVVAVA